MQIINNQEMLLVSKLKECITDSSEISISTDYYTFNSLFLLVEELALAKSLRIVVDNKEFENDIRFIYDTSEIASSLLLTSIYRLNNVLDVLKKKPKSDYLKQQGLSLLL